LGGAEGEGDLGVDAVLAEKAALGLGENAQDGILGAVDLDRAAHRVPVRKQGVCDGRTEQGDARGAAILLGSEEAAGGQLAGIITKEMG